MSTWQNTAYANEVTLLTLHGIFRNESVVNEGCVLKHIFANSSLIVLTDSSRFAASGTSLHQAHSLHERGSRSDLPEHVIMFSSNLHLLSQHTMI